MAAERATSPPHELVVESIVDFFREEVIRGRAKSRVLTRDVPIIPYESIRASFARILESFFEVRPKGFCVLVKRIDGDDVAAHFDFLFTKTAS